MLMCPLTDFVQLGSLSSVSVSLGVIPQHVFPVVNGFSHLFAAIQPSEFKFSSRDQPFVRTMSQPTWSAMDIAKLAKVLSEAKETGLLDAALAVLNADQEREHNGRLDEMSLASWEEVSGGAMTDASKRRSVAMTGYMDRPSLAAGCAGGSALPVVPAEPVPTLSAEQWNTLETRGHGLVPPGVTMKEWADTLLDFGKFKSEKLSFVELAASKCPSKIDYCKWVMSHENAKSTVQFKDLAAFLRVYKAAFPDHVNEPVFPGSQIARVFKSK